MALRSNLAAQLMMGAEPTYGAAVVPSKTYEFVSESIGYEIGRVESEAIRANSRLMRSDDWAAGVKKVAGEIKLEMSTKNWAFLWSHMLGSVATTGAGPYTHTCTPGDLAGKHLTIQVGRPSTDGTVNPFTYNGCKVANWSLSCEAGGLVLVTLGILGKDQTTATALAAPSYTSGNNLFSFSHGALQVGGATALVKKAELNGDNNLDAERFYLGQDTTSEPLEQGYRSYGGTLEADFESMTALNRYINGTEAALVLTFTRGTDVVTITENVRFDGNLPGVAGLEVPKITQPFKALGTSTDASGVTVAVTSSESSAA